MKLKDVASFELSNAPIHPISVCPINGAIAVGDGWRILVFDKVRDFSFPRVIEVRKDLKWVRSLCFSEDGTRLIGGLQDGSVVGFDFSSGEEEVLTKHDLWVECVSVSYDAGIVVSGSGDKTVRVCGGVGGSKEERKAHRAVGRGHTRAVNGIAFLKGEGTFVSGSEDRTLCVWDLMGSCLKMVQAGGDIESLALSPCGSQLVVGMRYGLVTLFGTKTWDKVWRVVVYNDTIYSVSFHGRYIATGSFDKTARILDAETGKVIKSLENGHSNWIMSVSFTPCGTSLLTTSGNHDMNLVKWPLFPKETRALASFFDASKIETLLYEEGGVWDFEKARSEVFKLASQEIIRRIKRVLYLKMEEGVVTCDTCL